MRELPSLAKGAGLRTLSFRSSWVQIPPPASSVDYAELHLLMAVEVGAAKVVGTLVTVPVPYGGADLARLYRVVVVVGACSAPGLA